MWTMNFQMFKVDLEKAEEPEVKLLTSIGSSKKQEKTRKTSTSALLIMPKPLTIFHLVQSLSRVRLFATPWTAAHQGSLSITRSWSPPNPCPLSRLMPSNHLVLCHSLLLLPSIFPSMMVFSKELAQCHVRMAEWSKAPDSRFYLPKSWLFASGGQSIRASASVFPMNIKGWFP